VTVCPDIAVLVASCDEFADVWPAFFSLFFKHWPDCPFALYLGSDSGTWSDRRVLSLTTSGVADKQGWSKRVRSMLERIPESWIVLLLEDFLLTDRVDADRIRELANYAHKRGVGYVRLYPAAGADVLCAGRNDIGENAKGQPYRICSQASLWEKHLLLELLRDGESIWQFEEMGSRRSNEIDRPFLSVTRRVGVAGDTPTIDNAAISYFCTAIVRGEWLRDAVALCSLGGVVPDLSVRPLESRAKYFERVQLPRLPAGVRIRQGLMAFRAVTARSGGLLRRVARRLRTAARGSAS
jgi:hypothetical protein